MQDIQLWLGEQLVGSARYRSYSFSILRPPQRSTAGGCQLFGFIANRSQANLSYWVRASERGRGFAGRAVRLMARFAFEELGLQRLEILIAVDNAASQRVAEKAGAVVKDCCQTKSWLEAACTRRSSIP